MPNWEGEGDEEPESIFARIGRAFGKPKKVKKPRKPRGPYWTTATGEMIRIKDMDTFHLKNTIRFLQRRKFALDCEALSIPEPQGEQAALIVSAGLQALLEMEVDEIFPIMEEMQKELDKRTFDFEE